MTNYQGIDLPLLTKEHLSRATREQLEELVLGEQQLRLILVEHIKKKNVEAQELTSRLVSIEGVYYKIRNFLFRPKTERGPRPRRTRSGKGKDSRSNDDSSRLPSERYPEADIIERHIEANESLPCRLCGQDLEDSGLTETSEYLTVIPKKFYIVRQHRHQYRCRHCHGDLRTVPNEPRVVPGGSYSDAVAVDVSLSKYCDLIPIERYSEMAKRQGFAGIPPQSLIGLTHKLAAFFRSAYELIRKETLSADILLADETPHRMLEGDEKKQWFLWGFHAPGKSIFFECHPTRSGSVAADVLSEANCEVLLSDVYSGYRRAVREANEIRMQTGSPEIQIAYCNAHARRGFIGIAEEHTEDALFMVEQYQEIYTIEAESRDLGREERLETRRAMRPAFEAMKAHAEAKIGDYSTKSGIAKGFSYFLRNYDGLTLCLKDTRIPLDNNASERLLRSPVVGRKTWYGTHSQLGAETASIHFTLVESCKLNKVNPRAYYHALLSSLHQGEEPFTPWAWRQAEQLPQPETS